MRVFLVITLLFICLSVSARAQNDAVTDDDVMKALHGGGTPTTSAPREYSPSNSQKPAEDGNEPPPAQSDEMAAPPSAEVASPSISSDKGSLRDLKAVQDAQDTEEGAPPLQAIGEGVKASCPAREVAATVKMPDTIKMIDPDGTQTKARKCENAFQKLPDACSEDNPCTDCEKAVKAYTDACMYVENKDDMRDIELPGGNNPRTRERNPINKIPYQQSGRP